MESEAPDPQERPSRTGGPPQEPCETAEPYPEPDRDLPPLPSKERPTSPSRPYSRVRRRILAVLLVAAVTGAVVALVHRATARRRLEDARELAEHYGPAVGLDPALVLAVIRAESSGDSQAVSHAGARGLMQLMPPTAQEVAERADIPYSGPDALFDPELNVRLGTLYLAQMRRQFNDDAFLYLAAYNAGPGRIRRLREEHPELASWELVALHAPDETRVYVRRVLRYWEAFREEMPRA